jgi:hypothetical protein
MTEVPPFLFVVTSTALVLGVAITIRGLLGFRTVAEDAAPPTPVTEGDSTDGLVAMASASDAPAPVGGAASDVTADPDGSPGTPAYAVRDLREPIVMTLAGVFICIFTLLAISALIHSV